MADTKVDREHALNGQLRQINEQQEENRTSFRQLEESEQFIQEAYSLKQYFLNELAEVFHASHSAQFLHDIEEEYHECKRQSLTQVEEQFEELQQEKKTLIEKESDILSERTALFQKEVMTDEY
jgi:hypothetical protein